MSIKDDNRKGLGTIWKQHVKNIGQREPEKDEPYLQVRASAELFLNTHAGSATAAYYHAIALALQDNSLHKPHSSELVKYPERANALAKHERFYGDYDAFYFTKDDAERYGLKTSNFYKHVNKLIELGMIKVVWRYDPHNPLKRKDGSSAKGWLGKNTPRTIYALSDKWTTPELERLIEEAEKKQE